MLRARAAAAPARPPLRASCAPLLRVSRARPAPPRAAFSSMPTPVPKPPVKRSALASVGSFVASMGKRETWKRWGQIAKDEWHHYKHGTIVFWDNLKTASKIMRDRRQKKRRLTRSERLHLSRTSMDFLKLGNLIPILVIPAAEFALPVILKLFPGFLPSTYATTEQLQGKLNANIKQKEEILSALQSGTEELFAKIKFETLGLKNDDAVAAWQRMRSGAMPLDTQEILHFAHLFHELFALDKLPRRKLEKVCQFFSLPTKGSDEFLINCIRIKMKMLREDDEEILEEGLYNLSDIDLREANIDRGVKGVKLNRDQLIKMLREWIELSSHALPPYLLVLSRSFTMSDHVNAKIEALEKLEQRIETLEKIAPKTAEEAKAKLEEAKEDVKRTIESEAAKPAAGLKPPAPTATTAAGAAAEGVLAEKIRQVESNLATAGEEVSKQGSTMKSGTAELVSKQIEEMITEMEKDKKMDQHKKDKIWLLQQFAANDKDKNGSITASEMQAVLEKMGERLSDESIVQLIKQVDKNKDMQVSFEEFQTVFPLLEKMREQEKKTVDGDGVAATTGKK